MLLVKVLGIVTSSIPKNSVLAHSRGLVICTTCIGVQKRIAGRILLADVSW